MKLAWTFFLGALLVLQLIGWQVFGRAQPIAAVAILTYPSAMLIGAFYSFLFYRDKTWLFAMPLLLILAQIQVMQAPRNAPRDSLIIHAMSQFLETKVTLTESSIGGTILLFLMVVFAIFTAFMTAEIVGRFTRQRHINGCHLLRSSWQMLLRWELKTLPGTPSKEKNDN